MEDKKQQTLWFDKTEKRYFLIPADQTLPAGGFVLRTLTGESKWVEETSASDFEVSMAEAKAFIRDIVREGLSHLKSAFEGMVADLDDTEELIRGNGKVTALEERFTTLFRTLMEMDMEITDLQRQPEALDDNLRQLLKDVEQDLGLTADDVAQLDELVDEAMNNLSALFDTDDDEANGLEAFEAVGQFLEIDGWFPRQIEGQYIYRMKYSGQNENFICLAQVRVDLDQLVFYVLGPDRSPEAVRLAVAEFITRANYGLRIGNFELDFSDGEVRYKSSLDFEGEFLSFDLIRNVIYPAVQTMDRYWLGLMQVISGEKSAIEAIVEVEDAIKKSD